MDPLPEELLSYIVAQLDVSIDDIEQWQTHTNCLLALSLTSRQLNRLAEPQLYRNIILNTGPRLKKLLKRFEANPKLKNLVIRVRLGLRDGQDAVTQLPHLETLRLDYIEPYNLHPQDLSDLPPFLRMPSLTALTVDPVSCYAALEADWNFTNSSIKRLKFTPGLPIENGCILPFAHSFRALETLTIIDSVYTKERDTAFLFCINAFQESFAQSLRSFSYTDEGYNYLMGEHRLGFNFYENAFDILAKSQLTHLQATTDFFRRRDGQGNRPLDIASALPRTLRTLELTHVFSPHEPDLDAGHTGTGRKHMAIEVECFGIIFKTLKRKDVLPVLERATVEVRQLDLDGVEVLQKTMEVVKESAKEVDVELDLVVKGMASNTILRWSNY